MATIRTWEAHGLKCGLAAGAFGNLNGYVWLSPEHADHGKDYDDIDVDVHGGLTFARPAKEGDCWIVGFDTSHFGDSIEKGDGGRVWFADDVARETESLAAQLAARAKGG